MISGLETPEKSCNGPHPWQKWAVCELQCSGKIVPGSPPCTAQLRAGATCQTLPREKKEADWGTDWKSGVQIEKARSTDSPRKAWGPSKVGVDGKVKEETGKNPQNVLFHQKLYPEVPEKTENEEMLEIFE